MFIPLNCSHGRKCRTHFMLAAGGRVVRADHDPRAASRLMVPTESELKTIMYDQTGVRTMKRVNRENIDYVALHANRGIRRDGSSNRAKRVPSSKPDHFGGHKKNATEPQRWRLRSSSKSWTSSSEYNSKGGTGCRHLWIGVNPDKTSSEEISEEDSGEEDVSLFLDYFSKFGIASGGEAATAPLPSSSPRQAINEQTLETDGVDVTEATLEMSKSLANVDIYSILSRPAPAELGRTPSGLDMVTKIGDTPIVSKSWGRKRDRHSTHKNRGSVGRGYQRMSETEPKQEVDYMAKDPLGEEVAQMRAKIQADSLRVKQEAEREHRSPGIDVKRHAALFAQKSQTLNATRLASFAGNHHANADAASPSKISDFTLAQELLDGCDELYPPRRCRRKRHEGRAAHMFGRGSLDAKPTLGKPKEKRVPELRSERGRERLGDAPLETENPGNMKGILRDEESLLDGEGTGLPRCNIAGGGGAGAVPVERALGAVGKDGQPVIDGINDLSDDFDTDSYGQESFESAADVTRCNFEASSAGGGNSVVGAEKQSSGTADVRIEDGSQCTGYAYPRRAGAGDLSEENAAALTIETCWRGFLGRTDAKRALRSVLLRCLRKLGGGRVSKVMVYTDLEENDQRELNRTLRTATQSRLPLRHLPSQAHFLDCVHFVERLQKRRTQMLNTRRQKWIVQRAKRRDRKCTQAHYGGRLRLPVATIAGN